MNLKGRKMTPEGGDGIWALCQGQVLKAHTLTPRGKDCPLILERENISNKWSFLYK
jgi:hypothetical protein